MHVLIASAIGLAAVLLPSAALTILRGYWRQQRALRCACRPDEDARHG